MDLKDIGNRRTHTQMNKIIESRFGFKIDYANMTPAKATKMINFINESMRQIKESTASHRASQDPRYMEMQLVKESLNKYMKDYKPSNKPGQKSAPKLEPVKHTSKSAISEMARGRNYQMISRAIELASQGKAVPSKYMEGFVPLLKKLNERKLMEGELGKSEVILAAKDMVDTLQDMIEDISRMVNEELPPLVDSIRDQVGSQQADSFSAAANQALTTLLDSVKSTRESLDAGARQLAGDQVGAPMDMPGGDAGAAPAAPGAGDMGAEMPAFDADETDGFGGADAAAGGADALGREER